MSSLRGADVLAAALASAGVGRIFSLSGNHIMPVYDAALDARLEIVHVRHEGAAVHMADAWARLTGDVGIALLTGGPGHANGVGALYTALASESPLVMLSGHAPLSEIGYGSFQELRQADMAAPAVKASWTAGSAATLGQDLARAMRTAISGRPGPVHLSLPFDVLEAKVDAAGAIPAPGAFRASPLMLDERAADAVLALVSQAQRPLVLTGPVMAGGRGRSLREKLAATIGVPVLCMESPRGVNDPCLGAFAEILNQADLIVLLGKQPDFTLHFCRPPAVDAACRFVVIDPEPEAMQRALKVLAHAERVAFATLAEPLAAAERLIMRAPRRGAGTSGWCDEVQSAVRFRPAEWATLNSRAAGPVHPVEVGRAVQKVLDRSPDAVLVADGGEFGQWSQACVSAQSRIINGPGGSIGSAIPFALAAKLARPDAPVIAMLGDGTFGFHMAEFDTAVRCDLPVIAVVGNDACWNAEHQIQLRNYGKDRAKGCELLPARYDQAVAGLGGHGEMVTRVAELPSALERSMNSGKPACINVGIERLPAPVVSRGGAPRPGGVTH
ncbi:MAG TPA: thiamine pyrophosphate-binding protein [Burkholderiales bacterium]|nr:thiamine pyrophosphate-binding protein [Burkholderiales bacterium]